MAVFWKQHREATHVTREEALLCLRVSSAEFDRLCVLNNVYPYTITKGEQVNKTTLVQYKAEDITKIRRSHVKERLRIQKKNKKKADAFLRTNRAEKIQNLPFDRINYAKILLEKYPTFLDCLQDLGECLTCLLLTQTLLSTASRIHLSLSFSLLSQIRRELEHFFLFIIHRAETPKTFITKSGIYYQLSLKGTTITYKEAFAAESMEDILGINTNVIITSAELYAKLLEKVNFRLYKEEGLEEHLRAKRRELLSSPSPPTPSTSTTPLVDKSTPKITLSPTLTLGERSGVFKDQAFFVSPSCTPLLTSLHLLILSEGGEIEEAPEHAKYYLTDGQIEEPLSVHRTYIHPQYIYDSINTGAADLNSYRIGKEIPPHPMVLKERTVMQNLKEQDKLRDDLSSLSARKREKIERLLACMGQQ